LYRDVREVKAIAKITLKIYMSALLFSSIEMM